MPEYKYSVYDTKGQAITGTMEAQNEEECRRIISQRGLFCVSVAPVSLASKDLNFGGAPKFTSKEICIFARQFSAMLTAGVSIVKSLEILYNQAESPKEKKILKALFESIQRGQNLSKAMRDQEGAFPELFVNMVESGEAGGNLDEVMVRMADHYEKDQKLANKVKGAMMYPMILGILTVVVVVILMIFVLPTFIGMFESAGAELPGLTKAVVAISNSITTRWYVYLIIIAAIFVGASRFLASEKGRYIWDKFKVTMPKIGPLMTTVVSARFARTVSTLLHSGVPMIKALEITAKVVGNKYFEETLLTIKDEIKKGESLSASLKKSGIFPQMLLSMISIGEESGTMDEVLQNTANFYDEQSDAAIGRLMALLEPAMLVVMAGVIGSIVAAVMLPMAGMMSAVG